MWLACCHRRTEEKNAALPAGKMAVSAHVLNAARRLASSTASLLDIAFLLNNSPLLKYGIAGTDFGVRASRKGALT